VTVTASPQNGEWVPRAHADTNGDTLIGGHCPRCQISIYPAPAQCPGCLGPLSATALSDTGTLYTYSVVHIGPRGRPVPYTVGYVDLPEGARVFGHIDETDESRLRPGMTVRLRLRECEGGYRAVWTPLGMTGRADGDA
jgi:uncharacterized OB-fold protein